MCGIVGAIGSFNTNELVLEGLKKLEYRGYDSCGIAYESNETKIKKSVDKIEDLKKQVKEESHISIGHTRWATHGKVSLSNAHPHQSQDKNVVMVHNGVIENYEELKDKYLKEVKLKSETDTEVILETLNLFIKLEKNLKKAIKRFMNEVEGSYALIFMIKEEKNKLFVLKKKSPILIGKNEEGFTISSDILAVNNIIENFYQVEDEKFIIIDGEKKEAKLLNKNMEEEGISFQKIESSKEKVSKKGYETFMQKEIEEQANVLRNIVSYYKENKISKELLNEIKRTKRIYIVASGTSYHSGLVVKNLIQKKLKIAVECVIGSEYGYDENIIEKDSMFVFLSQSGETADSMLVFNQIKGKFPILALTNVKGSQMDREADYSLPVCAGIEISVASTKAYTAQIASMYVLIGSVLKDENMFNDLLNVANYQEKIFERKTEIENISEKIIKYKQAFYTGRLGDFNLALEASLKIKEVSYINISAIAAGELKHGTISLIDSNELVVCLINDEIIAKNTRSNIEEIKSRGGEVIVFSNTKTSKETDDFIIDYRGNMDLISLLAIIPHQYLAYYSAEKLGLNIDKPRNLAKSVTVE